MSLNIGGGYSSTPTTVTPTVASLDVSKVNPAVLATSVGTPAEVPVTKPGGPVDPSRSLTANVVQINTSTIVRVTQAPSKNVSSLGANASADKKVNVKLATRQVQAEEPVGVTTIISQDLIYVDPSHPNATDSGQGTETQPLVTIQAANSLVDPNGRRVVEIASGTYVNIPNQGTIIAPSVNGTALKPIIYQTKPGATVILTGKGQGNVGASYPIDFSNRQYCQVNGQNGSIILDGNQGNNNLRWDLSYISNLVNFDSATKCSVSNVESTQSKGWTGVYFGNSTDCELNTCTFRNHGTVEILSGESGQVGQDTGNMIVITDAVRPRVLNCTFIRGGHEIIEDEDNIGLLIRNCVIDNRWAGYKSFGTGRGGRGGTFGILRSEGGLWEGCVVRGGGIAEPAENANNVPTFKFAGQYNIFRNNAVLDNYSGSVMRTTIRWREPRANGLSIYNVFFARNGEAALKMPVYVIDPQTLVNNIGNIDTIEEANAIIGPVENNVLKHCISREMDQNPRSGTTNHDVEYWFGVQDGAMTPEKPVTQPDPYEMVDNVVESGQNVTVKSASGTGYKTYTLSDAQSIFPNSFKNHTIATISSFPYLATNDTESTDLNDHVATAASNTTFSSGIVKASNSGTNSTSLTVDAAYRLWDGGGHSDEQGDLLRINGTLARVASKNNETGAVTLDTAASWSNGDEIYLEAAYVSFSGDKTKAGPWGT